MEAVRGLYMAVNQYYAARVAQGEKVTFAVVRINSNGRRNKKDRERLPGLRKNGVRVIRLAGQNGSLSNKAQNRQNADFGEDAEGWR